jgi:phosphoribosylanthranilate isomerase
VTYLDAGREIAELCRFLGAGIVQLHGDVAVREVEKLKTLDPMLTVIKGLVIGLRDHRALESTISAMSPFVDAFIADTYDPATGASGATGQTHDWSVSRRLVELSDRPVILAGGLTPDNVRRAVLEVRPAGVDAHTGVEDASGRKSREKVQKFVSEARAAFEALREMRR